MKKMTMIATAFAAVIGSATTTIVNGIEWSYSVKDGKAVIEKRWTGSWFTSGLCDSSGACYENAVSPVMGVYPDSVVIPSKLDGYPVAGIGVAAFFEARYFLEKIKIPSSVTSIGDCAFACCGNLSSVEVPASVTEIGACAFKDCTSLTKVTLPMWCKNFRHYVPEYGRAVGILEYAFENCPSSMKVTYKGKGGVMVAEMWKKAQTVDGAVFRDGKANKNGEVSVSGTITGLDGKKLTAKGGKVAVNGETATATLTVKEGSTATVTAGNDGVSGSWNGAEINAAAVGGNWMKAGAKVHVDATVASLPSGTVAELLPNGEPVLPKGGKWAFNRPTTVKLSRDKTTVEWDTSRGKTNLSSMKFTYTPKTGQFKGSFKVYALEGAKLKKYTANVTGVVVDGTGYGQASIKKPAAGPWSVTVR